MLFLQLPAKRKILICSADMKGKENEKFLVKNRFVKSEGILNGTQ